MNPLGEARPIVAIHPGITASGKKLPPAMSNGNTSRVETTPAIFWLLNSIFADLIRDHEMSGWAKAAWVFAVIVFNWIGIHIYLIVRGKGMAERAAAEQVRAKADFDDYIRSQAGSASPAEQIEQAKALHDSGAISDEEYAALKAKALS